MQGIYVATLVGLLALGSASAQESRDSYSPSRAGQTGNSAVRSAQRFQLKGVLVSRSSRTALVNGRPFQEGDRVGGAEILSIEQRGIRVRVGVDELSVAVGGTFIADSPSGLTSMASTTKRQVRIRGSRTSPHAGPRRDGDTPVESMQARHTVTAGETLSGIALHYLGDGLTLNQMMIALYRSNPGAFSNNINLLHAGAVLRIPDDNELRRQSPAIAAADVARHIERWQDAHERAVNVADSSRDREYGPVENGETLSGIASQTLPDGITMNQMMVALYRFNPRAFGNNINVLRAGAVLRIPGETELRRHSPETATAEVLRQTAVWQARFAQDAIPAPAGGYVLASHAAFDDQPSLVGERFEKGLPLRHTTDTEHRYNAAQSSMLSWSDRVTQTRGVLAHD